MNETTQAKIKAVNALLEKAEPESISYNDYSDQSGYKPQYVMDSMNVELFGNWGFEEIETHTVTNDKGGQLAVAKVQVWLKDIEFRPMAWGQSRVTKGDLGDAKKGAQTDAIKKALSYFSVGRRAYLGLLEGKKK